MYQEEEVKQRYRDLSATIGPDLMHNSEGWTCFICGRPATDIDWMAVWTPGEKVYKRCVVTIRAGCEGCTPKMEKDTLMFSERANRHRVGGGYVFGAIPKPEGMSDGLSGACLTCRKETSATQELNMSRCGKCKFVRYCRYCVFFLLSGIRRFIGGYVASVACQKQDWARHKPVRSVAVPPDIGLKLLHRSAAKFEVFPGLIARRSNARLSSSIIFNVALRVTIGQGSDEYLLAGEEGLLHSGDWPVRSYSDRTRALHVPTVRKKIDMTAFANTRDIWDKTNDQSTADVETRWPRFEAVRNLCYNFGPEYSREVWWIGSWIWTPSGSSSPMQAMDTWQILVLGEAGGGKSSLSTQINTSVFPEHHLTSRFQHKFRAGLSPRVEQCYDPTIEETFVKQTVVNIEPAPGEPIAIFGVKPDVIQSTPNFGGGFYSL
ncbi:hypothetical protein B0H13DRAFT_1896182 [Mycena leptocephala]|nr:hypothetical protein B0H13DRAFT_1896182 [Mycena leptocephala]